MLIFIIAKMINLGEFSIKISTTVTLHDCSGVTKFNTIIRLGVGSKKDFWDQPNDQSKRQSEWECVSSPSDFF